MGRERRWGESGERECWARKWSERERSEGARESRVNGAKEIRVSGARERVWGKRERM